MDTHIVGVRFNTLGKVYHFDASKFPELKVGDSVIADTSRGWQLGQVAQLVNNPADVPEIMMKAIDRKATPRDLLLRQSWQLQEADVLEAAQKRSKELNLYGVKIVSAEYSFDGSRLTILFSTDKEDKVDLKSLRGDLGRRFNQTQVEVRQVGPRDVAKLMGGMGACGLETRCCSGFLCEFSSISIRMAKEQDISLTPTEITGMCGRLRCCLIYEYETYTKFRDSLPRKNKWVNTPTGAGRVIGVHVLRQMVVVELLDIGVREFHLEEIEVLVDGAPLPPKPVPPPVPQVEPEEVNKPAPWVEERQAPLPQPRRQEQRPPHGGQRAGQMPQHAPRGGPMPPNSERGGQQPSRRPNDQNRRPKPQKGRKP
jgi:cell fate regulator YaaT (PSP1 superfamily)